MSESLAFENGFRVLEREFPGQASEASLRDLVRGEKMTKMFWGAAPTGKYSKKSSSDLSIANIEFTDDPRTVTDKIMEIHINETRDEHSRENTVLKILRNILIPLSELRLERKVNPNPNERNDEFAEDAFTSPDAPKGTLFTIEVAIWCFGECVKKHYKNYEAIEEDFWGGRMGEEDLKLAVARSLNCVLEAVRRRVKNIGERRDLEILAYF